MYCFNFINCKKWNLCLYKMNTINNNTKFFEYICLAQYLVFNVIDEQTIYIKYEKLWFLDSIALLISKIKQTSSVFHDNINNDLLISRNDGFTNEDEKIYFWFI